jgi:hypothetical protein
MKDAGRTAGEEDVMGNYGEEHEDRSIPDVG